MIILILCVSCGRSKKLNLKKTSALSEKKFYGVYSSNVRGRPCVVHLDRSQRFRYEFSNCHHKGHHTGTYVLRENILTLFSDSIVQREIMEYMNGQGAESRGADSSRFVFAVSENGLHEMDSGSGFWAEPRFVKD